MFTWRTTSTPATTAPNTTRVTIVPRAALTVSSAIAATHTSHGWTYDTTTGVVTASADAWHKPSAEGDITITLWRRDTHDGPQVRLHRVTIPNEVPVTVSLGVLPADACGGQWDVRASDGTWLAGQQWQLPGCGAPQGLTPMFTWRTTSTPATTAPNTTRVTIVPRAALTVAAVMAALILTVSSAIAATHTSHGWTYDTATGVVTASADAWHKPGDGPITVTLWRRDTHDGTQTRLYRTTIPNASPWVPVTVTLGVIPSEACGGQWDVRASDGTWLAGQQWQIPGCGATTTTTTTTSSSTTTDPTWTSTTTAPTTTSTTSSGTSSTSTAATTTAGATGSTRPPTMSARPTGGAPLPVTGADLRLGLLGLGLVALGIAAVAVSRRTGRYAR